MDSEVIESSRVFREFTHMHGISVSQTGRIQPGSVMVNDTCSVDNLVTAVIVHVGHRQVMEALIGILDVLLVICLKFPAFY